MAEHLTDEEQIEALKRWWNENGRQLVVVAVVCLVGYFGWNGWKDHRQQQAEEASVVYQKMISIAQVVPGNSLTDEDQAQTTHLALTLKDSYGSSQYAYHAALMLARLAVESGDLDAAANELHWAMDNSKAGLSLLARLRLARVEAARENYDQALELLNDEDSDDMVSLYAEARGDIYLLQSNTLLAYEAYSEALNALESNNTSNNSSDRALLELKLNRVKPSSTTTPETKEGDA